MLLCQICGSTDLKADASVLRWTLGWGGTICAAALQTRSVTRCKNSPIDALLANLFATSTESLHLADIIPGQRSTSSSILAYVCCCHGDSALTGLIRHGCNKYLPVHEDGAHDQVKNMRRQHCMTTIGIAMQTFENHSDNSSLLSFGQATNDY